MDNKIYISLDDKDHIKKIWFDFYAKDHIIYVEDNSHQNIKKDYISHIAFNKIIYLNDNKKMKRIFNFFLYSNFVGYLKFKVFINKFHLEEWII
jgi:hypothetical protein